MSIDTIALFEVPDAKQAVDTILECALSMPDALCRVGERFGKRWTVKKWEWKDHGPHFGESLYGPGGFSISIGAENRIVEVWHVLRFSAFAHQVEEGQKRKISARARLRRF